MFLNDIINEIDLSEVTNKYPIIREPNKSRGHQEWPISQYMKSSMKSLTDTFSVSTWTLSLITVHLYLKNPFPFIASDG